MHGQNLIHKISLRLRRRILRSLALILALAISFESAAVPMAQASMLSRPPMVDSNAAAHTASDLSRAAQSVFSGSSKAVIPSTMGEIAEMHAPSRGGRLIYHLQDVHNHISAQTNLYGMVSALEANAAKRGKALLVLIEGVTGPVDTDTVAAVADEHAKEAVGAGLLRAGFLLGEEYAAITRQPGRIRLVGVEADGLYRRNTLAEIVSADARERVLTTVREIRRQLEKLKEHNFNATLAELESKRLSVESGALSITDYLRFLEKVNPSVLSRYPDIERMIGVARHESRVDFGQVEKESRQLISELMKKKSDKDVQAMVEQAQALKSGTLSPLSYYSSLLRQADRPYAAIDSYVAYLRAAEKISPEGLFDQILEAEVKVAEGLLRHPMAVELYKKIRWIERQEKFFSLKMIPQEWAHQRSTTLSTFEAEHALIRSYVAEQTQAMGYSFRTPSFTGDDLRVAVQGAKIYYQAAEARDLAMVRNIEATLKQYPESQYDVAYVAGGFHTPGVTALMKQRGLAYAVVRPQLETQIELNDEYDFPAFRKSEEETLPSRADFRREPGGVATVGAPAVAQAVVDVARVGEMLEQARAVSQSASANRPLRRAGFAQVGLLGAVAAVGLGILAFIPRNGGVIAQAGAAQYIDYTLTYMAVGALALIVMLVLAADFHIWLNRQMTPGAVVPHDEVDGPGLKPEQIAATKSNLYVSDLAKAGRLEPSALAAAQDLAASLGKKLIVIPNYDNGRRLNATQDEKAVYVPVRYLGKGIVNYVARTFAFAAREAERRGGAGSSGGAGLGFFGGVRAFFIAVGRIAGDIYRTLRGQAYYESVFRNQTNARDTHYAGILRDLLASSDFQLRVFNSYPELFQYSLAYAQIAGRERAPAEARAVLDEVQKRGIARALPALFAQLFRDGWNESLPLSQRDQASRDLKKIVDLSAAIPNVLAEGLPRPEKLKVPFEGDLFENNPNLSGRNTELHEPYRADNEPFAAFPVDGQGNPLTAGRVRETIREAMNDIEAAIYSGQVAYRVFTGGEARRLGAGAAALLSPANVIELLVQQGQALAGYPVTQFNRLPSITRFALQQVAASIEIAQRRGWSVEGAVANKTVVVPVNKATGGEIIDHIRSVGFFGLNPHQVIFVEQGQDNGLGVDAAGQVAVDFADRPGSNRSTQGHGDIEARHNQPYAAFTVDRNGNRTYRATPLHQLLASQDQLIFHHQISLNDGFDRDFVNNLRYQAIGLAASRLALNAAQFRSDSSGTKGGIGFYYPNEIPAALRQQLGSYGEKGVAYVESSQLNSPEGPAIKKEYAAIANMAVTTYDPALIAKLGYFPYIATARFEEKEGTDAAGKPVKYSVNPVIHMDLWSYGMFNQIPTLAYASERERKKDSEIKSPDQRDGYVAAAFRQDNGAENPVYVELAGKALENLTDAEAREKANMSSVGLFAATLFALSIAALTVFYGLGITMPVLQYFTVAVGAGFGIIGAFSAVATVSAIALVGSNSNIPAEGLSLEDAYRDAETLGLDKYLLEQAIIARARLLESNPELAFQVRIVPSGVAHYDYEKNTLNIGAGLVAESGSLTSVIRRELLLAAFAHEYDHASRAVNAPSTTRFVLIDELIAYPMGFLRYIALRLNVGFGLSSSRHPEQTYQGGAVNNLSGDTAKKRDEFVTKVENYLPQVANKSTAETTHLVINTAYMPASGPELKAYLDDAVEHAHAFIVRSLNGQASPHGVQITIIDTDGSGNAQIAYQAFNQLKTVNQGEARMPIGIHMVGYAAVAPQLSALEQGTIDLNAIISSVPELRGVNFDLDSNVFMLSGIDGVNTFGAKALSFNSRLQLALQLFAYSRYTNPTDIIEYLSAVIFQVYNIRVEERTGAEIDAELRAAIQA